VCRHPVASQPDEAQEIGRDGVILKAGGPGSRGVLQPVPSGSFGELAAYDGIEVPLKLVPVLVVLIAVALAPACDDNPTRPSALDLTGTWVGTSTYPNAPFQLVLTQTAGTLRGEYSDGLDRSLAVTGTYARPTMVIVVDFGDAKLNLNATLTSARSAQGVMFTSALGNREYPFTMTR
jgi:hypothetical protein